jgi:hypothetical protein
MIRSAFIYGYTVGDNQKTFYFNEGAGVQSFDVDAKGWALDDLRLEIQNRLNDNGNLSYSVTVNRTTRIFTISADAAFDLLPSESSTGSLFEVIGITSDKTGLLTYDSDVETGRVYLPQFPLEKYTEFINDIRPIAGAKSEAPSGATRGINFGLLKHMSCDFMFIADIEHRKDSPIESNPTGLQDARDFMDYCISFGGLEFFEDRTLLNSFQKCIQISNGKDKNGQGYKLDRVGKLYTYFQIKNLTFREIK